MISGRALKNSGDCSGDRSALTTRIASLPCQRNDDPGHLQPGAPGASSLLYSVPAALYLLL
jgi:hypothetical protein